MGHGCPIWVANDIHYANGQLGLRCRGRCTVCGWKGPVRAQPSVPDDLDVKQTAVGAMARNDALRHAETRHKWHPATV